MADKTILEAEIKSNIGEVAEDTEKLGKSTAKATKGVKKLSLSFKNLMKGAGIVYLLNKAFEVFQDVMKSNQGVMDGFNVAIGTLTIAFNDLFKFITDNVSVITDAFDKLFKNPKQAVEDFGDAISEGFTKRFEQAGDVINRLGNAVGKIFGGDFKGAFEEVKEAGKEVVDVITGVDGSFEDVKNTVVDYTKKVVSLSKAQVASTKAANRAGVEFAKLNAQYLKDAEIQRQIRDDETKTFAERIEANNKLNEILGEQQKLQREQIQVGIDAAQQNYNINASEENYIALQEQKVAMLELEETITGQLSEQKTNAVALEKELLETQNEVRAEGMSGLQRELEELQTAYKLKKEMARKSGMDTTAIEKEFNKQKSLLIQENVNTQLEAFSGLAGALSSLAGENKALAVASAVIDTYVGANKAFAQGGVAGFATGAAVIAAGLNNVRTILATDVPNSGGGGGTTAPAQPPAPQMMSGAFDLSGGLEPEPTRAYVVTDEMTNSQNQLANIRRRATI